MHNCFSCFSVFYFESFIYYLCRKIMKYGKENYNLRLKGYVGGMNSMMVMSIMSWAEKLKGVKSSRVHPSTGSGTGVKGEMV